MRTSLQPRRALRLGLAALTLALELAVIAPSASYAQSAPPAPAAAPSGTGSDTQGCGGDYPVSGGPTHGAGWFYTEAACAYPPITGLGPTRYRGYAVLDDDRANFWTEFRRFGGADVLGYPVSQPYHYPVGAVDGYWYQAFERGILQYHPETGRAEMANVFEQFTEADPCDPARPDAACIDNELLYFGIPNAQTVTSSSNPAYDPEQRMSWLTEPRFVARYFFDPVAFHSSEADRDGQTAFATQEQAWGFFGLPQSPAQRMVLREPTRPSQQLWPLVHSFMAQRFQKAGLELFMEDAQEGFSLPLTSGDDTGALFDPTIVPGDGKKGCVAVTAVGYLARTIGIDKVIPRASLQPEPADPHPNAYFTTYVPVTRPGQLSTQFQMNGTGFDAGEPITIKLAAVQSGGGADATFHVDAANADGSFTKVLNALVGSYTVTASGDKSGKSYSTTVDLKTATVNLFVNRPTVCQTVGLPVAG